MSSPHVLQEGGGLGHPRPGRGGRAEQVRAVAGELGRYGVASGAREQGAVPDVVVDDVPLAVGAAVPFASNQLLAFEGADRLGRV
ncbi:hypothetical protein [Kitasatospora sp. NPDC018614]|uniref:hypothetical protein n=1 Tax=Kitasatospora sp. NPDC018614 TaxID=3364026 RepID=UPI0037B40D61